VEEPSWVPGYIYGLNNTGREELREGRFPRYRRWRLEAGEPVTRGAFLIALGPRSEEARYVDGAAELPKGGHIHLGDTRVTALGVECDCECLLWDDEAHGLMAMGLRRLRHGSSELAFGHPVDVTYKPDKGNGTIYAQGLFNPTKNAGFQVSPWEDVGEESWKTLNNTRAAFTKLGTSATTTEAKG
jgi:hypothetical protein